MDRLGHSHIKKAYEYSYHLRDTHNLIDYTLMRFQSPNKGTHRHLKISTALKMCVCVCGGGGGLGRLTLLSIVDLA